MNILSFSRKQKILATIILGILLLLMLFAGYLFSTTFFSLMADGVFAAIWLVFGIIILLMMMLVLLLVYRIILIWSYRIQFNDTFLEVHMARIPFAQTFKCAYTDISAVRTSIQNVIEIVPGKGKPLRFIPASFDGGEEKVFRLLSQYIHPERFETDLRLNYKRVSRSQKMLSIVISFVMMGYVAGMLFQAPSLFIPLPLSWNYFGPWTFFDGFVSGFSVESPDSVWIARRSYFPPSLLCSMFLGARQKHGIRQSVNFMSLMIRKFMFW